MNLLLMQSYFKDVTDKCNNSENYKKNAIKCYTFSLFFFITFPVDLYVHDIYRSIKNSKSI